MTLNNNSISNLYPLRNLKKLTSLNLENNAIDDSSFLVDGQSYNNLTIIANLNKSNNSISSAERGSLTEIYLAGNSGIVSFEPLKSLSWTKRSGF